MRSLSTYLLFLAPAAVFAAPARFYGKRQSTDAPVFQFANALEQLETDFYSQALAKFQASDFTDAGFADPNIPAQLFTTIQSDEATHTSTLQSAIQALGQQPVNCSFTFDSALTDVATMAATARVVEIVGVGAYIGASTLVSDPVLLQSAASILTVEARHQSILNILSGTGDAIPQAFDIGLTPSDVLALAGPFISSCDADLGIPSNNPLTITNTGTVQSGTLLTFSSDAIDAVADQDCLNCQMMFGGAAASLSLPLSQCIVPDNVDGPVAIWITNDTQPLVNNVVDRATDKQVAGPVIAFIDSSDQTLASLIRSSSGSSSSSSGSSNNSGSSATASASESLTTETISPGEASSLLASASAEATASGSVSAAIETPAVAAGGFTTVSGVLPASATESATSSSATDVSNSSSGSGVPAGVTTTTGTSGSGAITVDGWSSVSA